MFLEPQPRPSLPLLPRHRPTGRVSQPASLQAPFSSSTPSRPSSSQLCRDALPHCLSSDLTLPRLSKDVVFELQFRVALLQPWLPCLREAVQPWLPWLKEIAMPREVAVAQQVVVAIAVPLRRTALAFSRMHRLSRRTTEPSQETSSPSPRRSDPALPRELGPVPQEAVSQEPTIRHTIFLSSLARVTPR